MVMKKILTLGFMCLTLTVFSQGYSIINIFSYKIPDNFEVTVYLNDVKVGTLLNSEKIQYKIYSEGRVKFAFDWGGSYKSTITSNIRKDSNYYVMITGAYLIAKMVDEKEGNRCLKNNNKVTETEEDLTNPIVSGSEEGKKEGTCFLISPKGYLITNYHIVKGNKVFKIRGISGDFNKNFEADVVAVDIDLDLALLRFKDQSLSFNEIPFSLGSQSNLQGSKAYVLGYPLTSQMGQEIKITEGIISANSGYKGTVSQYQFSAAVQPGNSGSPLFNEKGELIGVINSKLFGAEGAGYAIKSAYLSTFLKMVESANIVFPSTSVNIANLAEMTSKLKQYIFIIKSE
jgi:S1-C subfamily serine protease